MVKVHIHEDDEGMRMLYPAAAAAEVRADLEAAARNAMESKTPGGTGWTDLHMIAPPENGYRTLTLPVAGVAEAVVACLPRIEVFEVGFGAGNPFHRIDRNGHCYGFGNQLYLRLEADGAYLTDIWYDAGTDDPAELSALRRAIEAIDRLVPSIIADYWMNCGGTVQDTAFLNTYFAELEN